MVVIYADDVTSGFAAESKVQCTRLHCLLQVWDAALRAVCRARGVQNMPSFVHLMHISVGGLSRKPVRARCPGLPHTIETPYGLTF